MARTQADLEILGDKVMTPMMLLHAGRTLSVTEDEITQSSLIQMALIAAYVEWDEAGHPERFPDFEKWASSSLTSITDILDLELEEGDTPLEPTKPSKTT